MSSVLSLLSLRKLSDSQVFMSCRQLTSGCGGELSGWVVAEVKLGVVGVGVETKTTQGICHMFIVNIVCVVYSLLLNF